MTIIIEGPDGAGKTTLIQDLQHQLPGMEIHPRFCTSKGGPIDGLAEAVFRDVRTTPTHYIYDRHPLVSEYVYRTAIRGQSIPDVFLTDAMGRLRKRVARHSLVIWCLPPLSSVKNNVERDAEGEMPGVVENIEEIYRQYQMHKQLWPGRHATYDYTRSAASWEGLKYVLGDTLNTLWKATA